MTRGRHAGDEAGAGGHHEEDRDRAQDDGSRSQPPGAEEVAQDAERYAYRPGGYVLARAQERGEDTLRPGYCSLGG